MKNNNMDGFIDNKEIKLQKVLFITANDNERAAFLEKLENKETKTFSRVVCNFGDFGKYKVAHYHTPDQGDAASFNIRDAIEAVKPSYVILVGIACGGNSTSQKIGEVLISRYVKDLDDKKEDYNKDSDTETTFLRGAYPPSGQILSGLFEGLSYNWKEQNNIKAYFGDFISSDTLLNNPKLKNKIFGLFSKMYDKKAIGYEMEGVSAFRACRHSNITEWILVKGICDFGDGRKSENKQENQELAANNAVSLCHYVFSQDGMDVIPREFNSNGNSFNGKFLIDINKIKPISENKSANVMHYLYDGLGFYGRKNEKKWLNDFCDRNEAVLYSVVHGTGGIGKSKLLCEFIKENTDNQWHMCFLTESIIKSLLGDEKYNDYFYPKNLLVVIDYAAKYSEILGKWIAKLSENKVTAHKFRIVLIERQGKSQDDLLFEQPTPWLTAFYGDTHQTRLLEAIEYGFLSIQQLDSQSLFNMIEDYSKTFIPNKAIKENDKKAILDFVSTELNLTSDKQTPLIVLLVTDACLHNRPYREWNLELLVQNFVKRLEENWLISLCGNDKSLCKSLKNILVFSTVMGGLNINNDVPQYFSEDWMKLRDNNECRKIFESATGLENEVVAPIEPDFIGEFMVLNYLKNINIRKTRREIIENFYCNISFAFFFDKCIDDYSQSNYFSCIFDDFIELFKPPQNNSTYINAYTVLIAKFSLVCRKSKLPECTNVLRNMYLEDISRETLNGFPARLFALHLAELTSIKDYDQISNLQKENILTLNLTIANNALNELKNLYERYGKNDQQIVLAYVGGLANCALYTLENAQRCTTELSILYNDFCEELPEISVKYAAALSNFINRLNTVESSIKTAEDTILKMTQLYEKHVLNTNDYNGLILTVVNAVSNPELHEEVNNQTERLFNRLSVRQDKVVIEYAKGLNNMIALYTKKADNERFIKNYENEIKKYFSILESLYEQYSTVLPEVEIEYAKGIVNGVVFFQTNEANKLLKKLKNLCNSSKNNSHILIVRYIKALSNYLTICLQNKRYDEDTDSAFTEAFNLYNDYHDISEEILIHFAGCLYSMFCILAVNKELEYLEYIYEYIHKLRDEAPQHLHYIINQHITHINELLDI